MHVIKLMKNHKTRGNGMPGNLTKQGVDFFLCNVSAITA